MIKRIVEISRASYLHIANNQLCIDQNHVTVGSIPVEDLGVLLLAHPANMITQQALIACQAADVAVILCDQNYLPLGLMLPYNAHTLQSKILKIQIQAKISLQNKLWQRVIQSKLTHQAQLLQDRGLASEHLFKLALRVKPGDPQNLEAQGAQYYWPALFGPLFRRRREAEDQNRLLNYGYTIIRACVARAIVCGGLNPALGICHKNQYDAFALADDLMEPLRPMVDRAVIQLLQTNPDTSLVPASKKTLLELSAFPVQQGAQKLPLMVALHQYIASFREALADPACLLEVPGL